MNAKYHIKLSILTILLAVILCVTMSFAKINDDDEFIILLKNRGGLATGTILWDATGDAILWDASGDKILWN